MKSEDDGEVGGGRGEGDGRERRGDGLEPGKEKGRPGEPGRPLIFQASDGLSDRDPSGPAAGLRAGRACEPACGRDGRLRPFGERAFPTAFRSARDASFHGSCLRAASSSSGLSAPDRHCCRGHKSEPGVSLLWPPAASFPRETGRQNKTTLKRKPSRVKAR